MDTRSGFTLLEVLVALAIVATAWAGIAAALPRLLGPGPAVRAADTLEQLLREARAAASQGQTPVLVRLTGDGSSIDVPALGVHAQFPRGVAARLEGVTGWGRGDLEGAAIVFLPDGSSSGGRVTLSEQSGAPAAATDNKGVGPGTQPVSVHVAWLTGRIERRP